MYQNVNFQEKSDREVRKALEREELSNEEIKEMRSTIAPVEAKEVVVYDSGDEDTCSDLLLKRKISLKRGRKTARENQLRGSRLLALLNIEVICRSQRQSFEVSRGRLEKLQTVKIKTQAHKRNERLG